MNNIEIAKLFLNELTAGTFSTSSKLFTENSAVIAPGGEVLTANEFLKNFYHDNIKSKATIIHEFTATSSPNTCAIYLQLEEHKRNQTILTFNCIGIFTCTNNKIEHLAIIFDTYPLRTKFPELF